MHFHIQISCSESSRPQRANCSFNTPLEVLWTIQYSAYLLSRVRLFAAPCTVAHQAPLSMGILQARILEWVAVPSSMGSSPPRDQTQDSHIALYHLNHQMSPRILEWVAYPFSRGSSWPRNWTRVSYIAGGFFTSWAGAIQRPSLIHSLSTHLPKSYSFCVWIRRIQ